MRAVIFLVLLSIQLSGCSSVPGRLESVPELKLTLQQKLVRANEAYEEARLDRAESLFIDITKSNPGYREAWLKLGNIYVRQMRLKAAIHCFEEAIKLDKNDGRAWYNLALVRVKQATKVLETAELVVPFDSEYQMHLLDLHQRLITKVTRD